LWGIRFDFAMMQGGSDARRSERELSMLNPSPLACISIC